MVPSIFDVNAFRTVDTFLGTTPIGGLLGWPTIGLTHSPFATAFGFGTNVLPTIQPGLTHTPMIGGLPSIAAAVPSVVPSIAAAAANLALLNSRLDTLPFTRPFGVDPVWGLSHTPVTTGLVNPIFGTTLVPQVPLAARGVLGPLGILAARPFLY